MNQKIKKCFVSTCKNTSLLQPKKEFIPVPSRKHLRLLWFKTVGQDPNVSSLKSSRHICEDHFDLPNDMENYLEWKMTGCKKRMKTSVVPHKLIPDHPASALDTQTFPDNEFESVPIKCEDLFIEPTEISLDELKCEPLSPQILMTPESPPLKDDQLVTTKEVEVFARPQYCSPAIQVTSQVVNNLLHTEHSITPIELLPETPSIQCSSSQTTFKSSSDELSGSSEDLMDTEKLASLSVKLTFRKIKLNPQEYLGVSKNKMWIIKEIENKTGLNCASVYIALMKIKTARTFAELSHDFGITKSTVSLLFEKAVTFIAPLMRELIMWPSQNQIKEQLPAEFRGCYDRIGSIVYCLEIEIAKRRGSLKQSLTWSKYKNANTVKYLISVTPDGVINFVSKGYGGGTTDETIVENCGYLDNLQEGTVIMADEGFQNIDWLLIERGCSLVRSPQSVSDDVTLSNNQVLRTKKIVSLRTPIERVIRRITEYRFLKPYDCIHSKLIPLTDQVMYIVCGLVNLQDSV